MRKKTWLPYAPSRLMHPSAASMAGLVTQTSQESAVAAANHGWKVWKTAIASMATSLSASMRALRGAWACAVVMRSFRRGGLKYTSGGRPSANLPRI